LSARNPRRERPEHVVGRLTVVRRYEILTLGDPVRGEHLIAQLAQTSPSPAILPLATRAGWAAIQNITVRCEHSYSSLTVEDD